MPRWFHRTLAFLLFASVAPAWAAIPVYGYQVVHAWPHDTAAYTEGLFYKDGHLYESTGQVGESTVRKVALETGEVLQRHRLPRQYFGEGIVDWKGRMVQLTWQSGTGFVYDLASFTPQKTFSYPGEGWALTRDDRQLYMSDGTAELRVLDPETLAEVRRIQVTADGVPVTHLNELEWVDGEIYANVWLTDRIARIDPASGHVVGWIDLSGLFDISQLPNPVDDVLNGIAWDAAGKRLFVTGKCWPRLFEIRLVRRADR
ncbi:glutaminyl-peptide cyclotransferase [Rhodanobacter spathiphylli]|uniref:Glutamine cyclotransferase n=1 Tax=Rhodanobacter spathiphylli B39 TaxID=1163407 RepID=I4W353_9GAMM|nr:glutaminyl-peptide cyclotransferase [Rhodanobacter spathiphylli]EIL93894.1 glutamine cyclotransferase [Rhodanobacter spathiphylli B39]